MGRGVPGTAIRVLFSFGPGRRPTANPYAAQLASSMPATVRWEHFSWWNALCHRHDVVHLHWPELTLRNRRRIVAAAKYTLFAVLLGKWALTRTAIVQTLHNEHPHERGDWIERSVLGAKDRRVAMWIAINRQTAARGPQTLTILHGHYRDWYRPDPGTSAVDGRLLFFGLIRAYKGVPRLVRAFADLDDDVRRGLELRVVGEPNDETLADEVRSTAAPVDGVTAHLRAVDEQELVREITASEIVVLPYERMTNSGAALTALSLDRPVVAPCSATNAGLRDEVGEAWVTLYDPPLDAAKLGVAIETVRAGTLRRAEGRPDLSARDWVTSGAMHVCAYRRAVEHQRRLRRIDAVRGRHGDVVDR